MKTSRLLVLAKKYLGHNSNYSGNSQRFICWAIERTGANLTSQERVKRMIHRRLAGWSTLEDWLKERHNIVQPEWHPRFIGDAPAAAKYYDAYNKFIDRMQITRHAWIDSMIAEFRAKGD